MTSHGSGSSGAPPASWWPSTSVGSSSPGTSGPATASLRTTLAADLGVSRLPVREAVIELARDGVVTVEPHSGAFVGPFDPEVVRHHFEIVGLVYGVAAETLAETPDADALAELADLDARIDVAADAGDAAAVHAFTMDFLRVMNLAGGSPRQQAVLRGLARMLPTGFFDEVPGAGESERAGAAPDPRRHPIPVPRPGPARVRRSPTRPRRAPHRVPHRTRCVRRERFGLRRTSCTRVSSPTSRSSATRSASSCAAQWTRADANAHADPRDLTGLDEEFERTTQHAAGARGFLAVSLPTSVGGGGRSSAFRAAFGLEAAAFDAPIIDTALTLGGAPIVAYGSDEQRAALAARDGRAATSCCASRTPRPARAATSRNIATTARAHGATAGC